MDLSTIANYLLNHIDFVVSLVCSCVFLLVNIIQAIRSHDKSKLKEALCRIPEIICEVEQMFGSRVDGDSPPLLSGALAVDIWSYSKKQSAFQCLENEFGKKFVRKYKSTFDDAIEDILNTPQKKGGPHVS